MDKSDINNATYIDVNSDILDLYSDFNAHIDDNEENVNIVKDVDAKIDIDVTIRLNASDDD